MSERKAINKYYPPDYDPSKVPKKKKSTNPNVNRVRLMLPFSMKCILCNEYISARRKFNARKETTAEKYMGVKIIKFHIKCPRCNAQLVFRTDPKSSGFESVSGVVRNYVSSKAKEEQPQETEDQILERLEQQERENQDYQQQKSKRKSNPFWQAQNQSESTLDNFEEKLLEQQKEQQMHDQLTMLQAKAAQLENSGGADAAIRRAQAKLQLKRPLEEFVVSSIRKPKLESVAPQATVLGKIQVNPNMFKTLKILNATKRVNSEINLESKPKPIAELKSIPAKLPSLPDSASRADKSENGEEAEPKAKKFDEVMRKQLEAEQFKLDNRKENVVIEKIPVNPAFASLAGYSSSDD